MERLREVCVTHELPAVFNELLKGLPNRQVLGAGAVPVCWCKCVAGGDAARPHAVRGMHALPGRTHAASWVANTHTGLRNAL